MVVVRQSVMCLDRRLKRSDTRSGKTGGLGEEKDVGIIMARICIKMLIKREGEYDDIDATIARGYFAGAHYFHLLR